MLQQPKHHTFNGHLFETEAEHATKNVRKKVFYVETYNILEQECYFVYDHQLEEV